MKLHRTASKALQAFLCGSAVFAFSAFGNTAKSSDANSQRDAGTVTTRAHDATFENSGAKHNDFQVADHRDRDDWNRDRDGRGGYRHGDYRQGHDKYRGHFETRKVLVRPGYYERYQVWVPGYFDFHYREYVRGHYETRREWVPDLFEYRQVWVRW